MKKIIFLIFIAASLLIVNTSFASACSCMITPIREAFEESTAVFSGKVVDVNIPSGIFISSGDLAKVTFEVSKIWKGSDYKTLVLTTARGGASCGYSFRKGEEYLVYAHGAENELQVSLCSRTKPLSEAGEDLTNLSKAPADSTGKFPLDDKTAQYRLENLGNKFFVLTYTKKNFSPISIYVSHDTIIDLDKYTGKNLMIAGKFVKENSKVKCELAPCPQVTNTVIHIDSINDPIEAGTPEPAKPVSVESIKSSLTEQGILDKVESVDGKKEEKKINYAVTGFKKAKLFFLIPVEMRVKISVNGETGAVEKTEKPWWSFLAKFSYNKNDLAKFSYNKNGNEVVREIPKNTELQFTDLSDELSLCFLTNEAKDKDYVINSEYDYNLNFPKSKNSFCDDAVRPPIDFSQKTLLGKYVSAGGCKVDFKKKVYRDDENKKIIYEIDVVGEGSCEKVAYSPNLVTISKIPKDYNVKFKVEIIMLNSK